MRNKKTVTNTDKIAGQFGGSGKGNMGASITPHGRLYSMSLTLTPQDAVLLRHTEAKP